MKIRFLLLLVATAIASLSGCGGTRESAYTTGRDEGPRDVRPEVGNEAGHAMAADVDDSTRADTLLAAADLVQAEPQAAPQAEPEAEPIESNREGTDDQTGTGPTHEPGAPDEGVIASQAGPEVAGSQPDSPDTEGRGVELVISAVAPASGAGGPTDAEGGRRGLCIVATGSAGDLNQQQALLYSYFTADIPEPLKKLAPGLLESSFGSTKLGAFSGGRGAVSGMQKFDQTLPDEVVLFLPRGSDVRGSIGVRAQLWRLCDGQWQPRSEVLEQTITLE